MPFWSALSFQNSNSPLMTQLEFFHDHILMILTLIICLVGLWLVSIILNMSTNRSLLENQTVESVWTIAPLSILLLVAFPSLRLLYLLDESSLPSLTLKITGNQWYWSYEYSDFPDLSFDSYMIPSEDSLSGIPRLLDTDNRITLPVKSHTRLLITASDVIHSWTLPSLGLKVDAIPGRLNQTDLIMNRPGLFFGQCSEICGANHSFMPITVESTSHSHFIKFISN